MEKSEVEGQRSRSARCDDDYDDEGGNEQTAAASNATTQPESSKAAAQGGTSNPPTYRGSCASIEFAAVFVRWPFKAPGRGQTLMPLGVAKLVHELPTKEEQMVARELWIPSLPVAANVGVIEFNRLDDARFKKKADVTYGEGWWKNLQALAATLNEAAKVVKGEDVGDGMSEIEGKGKGVEGMASEQGSPAEKGAEMETVDALKGKGKESVKVPSGSEGTPKEPETKTLHHLADAAALVVKSVETSKMEAAKLSTGEGSEPQLLEINVDDAEAAMGLLCLSETPAADSTIDEVKALAASNALSALWYFIDRFFSLGGDAASYFFVAMEAAIRLDRTTVHPLNIPAPPAFWADAANWKTPRIGLALILTLAASPRYMFHTFAPFSKSLGAPPLKSYEMRLRPSASLRKAVLRARADAVARHRTTVLGVILRDVRYSEMCEFYGKDTGKHFATFARMFALGVCPEGAKLWLVGGDGSELSTVRDANDDSEAGVGTFEEMNDFVREFEIFAVSKGQWNRQRFKSYRRCFGVDLKAFDLQIDEEEKAKRGMQPQRDGVKGLLSEIEAWVEIITLEGVRAQDVGKFNWL